MFQNHSTASFEALSPSTTTGDLIYHDGARDARLPSGAAGQVLQMGASVPAWGALSSVPITVATKAGAYTLTSSDSVILADAVGGGFTLTLPTAVGLSGHVFHVKKIDVSANVVVIDGNGAETIDGAATVSISIQFQSYTMVSNGAAWQLI